MKKLLYIAFCLLGGLGISHGSLLSKGKPPLQKEIHIKNELYSKEEVSYHSSAKGVTISGTLTLPEKAAHETVPAVLLISGDGRTDRDASNGRHKPFAVIADHLTDKGIAVLRVDKRGVGKSTGDYSSATSKDLAIDVLAGVSYLQSRKEISSNQIGLVGHSEGGLIAPLAALHSDEIAFLVLMAGPAVPGEEVLLEQTALRGRADNVPEEEIQKMISFKKDMYSIIKQEDDIQKADKLLKTLAQNHFPNKTKDELIQKTNNRWFRFFLSYDPSTTLEKIRIPVLALSGDKDVQVSLEQNLNSISKALARANNPHYTIKKIKDVNHMLQRSKTGAASEYEKTNETVSPVVLETVSSWIIDTTTSP